MNFYNFLTKTTLKKKCLSMGLKTQKTMGIAAFKYAWQLFVQNLMYGKQKTRALLLAFFVFRTFSDYLGVLVAKFGRS